MYEGIYLVLKVHYVYLLVYKLSVICSFIFFNIKYEYNITLMATHRPPVSLTIATPHLLVSFVAIVVPLRQHKDSYWLKLMPLKQLNYISRCYQMQGTIIHKRLSHACFVKRN